MAEDTENAPPPESPVATAPKNGKCSLPHTQLGMPSNNARQVETPPPPKVETNESPTPPPPVKTEAPTPQRLDTLPSNPSVSQTPDVAMTPTPPKAPTQVKNERVSPPVPVAEKTPVSTPAPVNDIAAALAIALGTSPAAAALPSPATPCSPAPVAGSVPVKRSRSSELGDRDGDEKRQKTDHVQEPQAMELDDTNTEDEPEPEAPVLLNWDLSAQLSSVLGSVDLEAGKSRKGTSEGSPMDLMPAMPLLPPPRKRLEKMKFIENPTYFSRAMGLPMLGSLSVQILLALFQQPSEVTDRQIRDVRTEGGRVYSALRHTFMAVLKLFAEVTAFLSADDLDVHDPGDRETIQMANLASMCASFYGPGGPTMATAHDNFLKIMIPENGMITEDISDLYLDQKTQSFLAYANVMEDKESTRNSLMDKFFPLDLEAKLKEYWKDSNLSLTKSAEEFVQPYTDRRNLLRAVGHDKEKRKGLEAKYQFATFLDNLSAFIRSNFDSILDYAESHGFEVPNEAGEEDLMLMDAVASSSYQGSFPGQPRRSNGADMAYDAQGLASLITEKLNGFDGYTYGYGSSSGIPESTTLPPTQSLPTSVLYEQARQAAVAKSSAHARREGLHSTRRPWTPEEEKALMAGLDMVKGPHWSQILQLFGQNGTLSDILKDRTQVQLKDKARNLKLFFLKTNSEMPYYLQCVTGELRTRAPSQAARKEAEEQARVQAGGSSVTYASSYANGTTNGAPTLAQGLSSTGPSRPNPAGSTTSSTTPGAATAGSSHQQQPSHQYQRPQQLQPAASGPTHSSHTSSQQAAKPMAAQSQHHQPIAPAPAYQRPLQQAPATTTSLHPQRPVQQTHPHPSRPPAAASTPMIPPRPTTNSATPQAPPRPLSAVSQTAATNTRPAPAHSASSSRPVATAAQGAASATTYKSVPTIMPAPPSSASPSPAPTSARPAQHIPAKISQPPAKAPGTSHAPVAAATTAKVAPVMPAPPAAAPHPAPKPAQGAASTAAPQNPAPSAKSQPDNAQKTSDTDNDWLAKRLQAALQES